MPEPTNDSLFDRLIAPWPFLLGIAAAFVGCCLLGYWVSRHNHIRNFERFHLMQSPESLYYPTVCQVRQYALSRLDPNKIVVVIAGSSVMHGCGQSMAQLWTNRLQDMLGDQYQVLNLGVRRGTSAEFGGVAAEFLERDFKKIILVSDVLPGQMFPDPDGFIYKYFFWDAYYKGLLLKDETRDRRLAELVAADGQAKPDYEIAAFREFRVSPGRQQEMRTGMLVDRGLYFNDLWNTAAYTRFHTVWTASARDGFTQPRRKYQDNEPCAAPLAARYPPQHNDRSVDFLRKIALNKCVKDREGGWVENPAGRDFEVMEQSAAALFPSPVRGRTLLVLVRFSPHYYNQLSAEERASYAAVSRISARRLEKLGFAALDLGDAFQTDDFADVIHLTDVGGYKMAQAIVPRVRAMARELGYVQEGGGR